MPIWRRSGGTKVPSAARKTARSLITNLAGHRLFEPGDAAQRRRFAAAARAEKRKQFALANFERDAVEGAHLALRAGEGFDQIFNAYHDRS